MAAHELSSSKSTRNSDTRLSFDSTPRVRVATSARRMSQRVSRMSIRVRIVSELGFEMLGLASSRSAVCWMLFLESSRLFCSFSTSCEKTVHHLANRQTLSNKLYPGKAHLSAITNTISGVELWVVAVYYNVQVGWLV